MKKIQYSESGDRFAKRRLRGTGAVARLHERQARKDAERCGVVRYVGDGDGLNKKGLSLQYQRINLAGNFGQSII